MNSQPSECGPFKISFNTHKDKWSINELLTMFVHEEERLIQELGESAHMVTHEKDKKQVIKRKVKANHLPIVDLKRMLLM